MIDSVWTSDHHPSLCGTAKFSHQLAQRLGVPVNDYTATHPLISVRASEWDHYTQRFAPQHDLFLHDWWNNDGAIVPLVMKARHIYAANENIAKDISTIRPDVVTLWAPSTIQGNPHRGTINVLTFGMAHKIQPAEYEKLKELLDATGEDYTVSVSTAIHEGSPWDETALVADRLRSIFGSSLRVLGYLADDALAKELQEATAVAIFYDPALRANNTSFWAALELNGNVITNRDDQSPPVQAWNIDGLKSFPIVHFRGLNKTYTWDRLVGTLQGQPCEK